MAENEPKKRGRGRPKGGRDPTIDWDSIARLYVYGEPTHPKEGASRDDSGPVHSAARKYPSYRELARRFGASQAAVHRYCAARSLKEKREDFQRGVEKIVDAEVAKSLALSTVHAVGIIDMWTLKFLRKLEAGQVRADSVGDLDKALRLKNYLLGEADSRTEQTHKFSLDKLQDSHRELRAVEDQADDDEVAGVVETKGEEVPEPAPPAPDPPSPRPHPPGYRVGWVQCAALVGVSLFIPPEEWVLPETTTVAAV